MCNMRTLSIAGISIIAMGTSLQAAVYNVGAGQTYTTIQAAVDAAAATDSGTATNYTPRDEADRVRIVVHGGTYIEQVNIPGDPTGNIYDGVNDRWTIENAPGATVWLNGGIVVGTSRDNGVIRGINIQQSAGTGWAYNFSGANTARAWQVSDGIIYNDGTNTNGAIYANNLYGTNTFSHMTVVGARYGISNQYASSMVLRDSIIADSLEYAIAAGGTASYPVSLNTNLITDSGIANISTAYGAGQPVVPTNPESNIFNVDPLFASTTWGDPDFLKLLPNSPAAGIATAAGQFSGTAIGALGVVPEPASLSLLALAAMPLVSRRRRA